MKKILLITYSFPPVAANRSKRATNLVKNLSAFGWKPYVLTVKNPAVCEYDYTYATDYFEGISITRTWSINFGFGKLKKNNSNYSETRPPVFKFSTNFFIKIFASYKDFIFYPDTRIVWFPSALIAGFRIIKRHGIHVIMVIGEPYSSFLIGVLLRFITGLPLVIDFRDEWVGFNEFHYPKRQKILDKLDRMIESIVIRNANLITVTTEGIRKNFIFRYPKYKNKFCYIPNGFDQSDFQNIKVSKHSNRRQLTITYCGSVYEGRTIRFFLQALEEILREHPEFTNDIKFVFVGTKDKAEERFFKKPLLKKIIEDCSFLPHRIALDKMLQSDLLLCLRESDPRISYRYIPGKIYEYLACQIPILALVLQQEEIASLIRRTNSGVIITPDDVKGIKNFLIDALMKIKNGQNFSFKINKLEIEKLAYINSAKALAGYLDRIVNFTDLVEDVI